MFKKKIVFSKILIFFLFGLFLFNNIYSFDKNFYKPKEKIFTPNGDGINDTVAFPNLEQNRFLLIRIFDVNGKKVRDLKYPYIWDGKDNSGHYLNSGVYLYQFKIKADKNDSEYINGTLTIAK